MSNSVKGFTLIELLISITIVGVILVIVMAALRIGVRAWESGERDIEINQRQQIVLSLIKQQMASACWDEIQREDAEAYYFSGKPDFMEFISSVSIAPENSFGRVYVAYRIVSGEKEGLSLEVAEQSLEKINPDASRYDPGDEEFQELISGAEEMSFEYLMPAKEGQAVWVKNVAPSKDTLPSAVRFNLKMTEKTPLVSVIARITAEEDLLQQRGVGLAR
jgi:general secretion pathway protein J